MLDELMFLLDLLDDDEELLEDFLDNDEILFSEENPFDKLQAYLNKYGHLYSFNEQLEIFNNLFYIYEDMQSMGIRPPYIYAEIMSHCGVLSERFNFYTKIFDIIKQNHNNVLNKSILDVGCGRYPAFVEMIAKEIHNKKTNGKIDGIDPKAIVTSIENVKNSNIFKTIFTTATNVDNYDLLTGLLPCEATEALIKKACSEEKELALVPCGCLHPAFGKNFNDCESYIKFLNKMIKKYKSNAFANEINSFFINGDEGAILSLVRK